jgi:signal transduction histidine kinase
MTSLPTHIALTLVLIESLGLAVLLLRAEGVPGLRLLVAFLCGVAGWLLSCELPVWFGSAADGVGNALVGFSALTSAVFLHFVLVLCGVPWRRRLLPLIYALGSAATIAALLMPPGHYHAWREFDRFFFPNTMGWVVGSVWAAMALAGHAVLFVHWWQRKGPPRGQLVAMCMASGWGALCMSGYAFAPLGIDAYPFPLLLLPVYPLILVYGILRYQLMIVNAWARRALAWTLTVGLGSAAVIAIAALPLPFGAPVSGWRLWAVAVSTLLASGLLLDPFRRLATRLIYPGSHLAEGDIERWREQLAEAETFSDLAQLATQLLSRHLRLTILVRIAASDADAPLALLLTAQSPAPANVLNVTGATPELVCIHRDGRWRTELAGWGAAPPGPRYVAQLFGSMLADMAQRLEHSIALARRERDAQQQQRLAELGALAATVAHDIRNPLNIIAMAAAMAPPEARREIAIQTTRISQLATDLLDYAKSWQIQPQTINVADWLHALTANSASTPSVELGFGLQSPLHLQADPRRLQQALANLLDNARAAVADQADARICIDAIRSEVGATELWICDNGPGIPEEIRQTLFQPFVSRRTNGTGLGLAIVAKIMQAHGGEVRLDARNDWNTCFVLSFPPTAESCGHSEFR